MTPPELNPKGQRTMKIWRNLEGGYHVHYSNKLDAVKGLKKAILENGGAGHEDCTMTGITNINDQAIGECSEEPELIEAPVDKKGLIKFLNSEARYTGCSPE